MSASAPLSIMVGGVPLPVLMTTEQASGLLDCSTDVLYDGARNGTAPVEPLRLGTRLRWPTMKLLEVLGIVPDQPHTRIDPALDTPDRSSAVIATTPTHATVAQSADRALAVA